MRLSLWSGRHGPTTAAAMLIFTHHLLHSTATQQLWNLNLIMTNALRLNGSKDNELSYTVGHPQLIGWYELLWS